MSFPLERLFDENRNRNISTDKAIQPVQLAKEVEDRGFD